MKNQICDTCEGEGYTKETCGMCHGSGEGMYDGSTCSVCKGSGVVLFECDDCDLCNECGEMLEDCCCLESRVDEFEYYKGE